jgi:FKBP-type peptidyl-prolyl cis-trans isomerase FklB
MDMKTLSFVALTGLVMTLQTASAADDKPVLKDQKEKVSYGIGMSIATQLKSQGAEVDVDLVAKAMKDVLSGGSTLMTQQEMQETMRAWQMEMRNKYMEKQKVEGEKNKKEGEAFLAENAKKPGVISLPDGLQYKVLVAGTGKSPTSNDVVKAHYKGTLIDGTEFDSSYSRGQPFTTPVTRVIRGWTEALLKMKVGDKWQLFIPGNLAYGERGSPPKIGPNAVLIFEMELLGVEENKAPASATTLPFKPQTNAIKLQPK